MSVLRKTWALATETRPAITAALKCMVRYVTKVEYYENDEDE